ncbi:hypothetical protein WOLCODRAFT_132871 [Wolfiporia cocos MD-104 SS10]|uniref:Uncharacterized protein n=1 Tax=Wolfiporia cocos (strain MD-104) TaxID=742152 RepID=A0A2H3JXK9_WOLCO|nr:hypothetical protein WOLCODRAFT_132871 [Wolfiporia cocos MD-104 SS10]
MTASSPPSLGYADGTAQDRERASSRLRLNIGRPVLYDCASPDDAVDSGPPPARRRSIPNHAVRPPAHHTRPTSRRPSHAHSSSSSSTRRPSLPTILLQPSVSPTTTTPPVEFHTSTASPAFLGADDLYSNLSSFTFGSARSGSTDHASLGPPSGTSSADRTPRPSVSGPSSRSRTPRTRPRDVDDVGTHADDEHEHDDEAAQNSRAKMRAMNDGTRRPSLPMSVRAAGRSKSPASTTAATASPASPMNCSGAHSETESETGSAPYMDGDGGDFDTDVEIDYQHSSGSQGATDTEMADPASHRAFSSAYMYDTGPEADVIMREAGGSKGEAAGSELHEGILGSGREREGSVATLTGFQIARHYTDEQAIDPLDVSAASQAQSHAASQALDQQLQKHGPQEQDTTGESAGKAADASDAWDGWDVNYVLGGRTGERGDRRSWQSTRSAWLQMQPIPPHVTAPPISGAGASAAGFEAFNFEWGAPVTGAGPVSPGRRTSTVTVGSGEDAFTRHVQRFDPVSSTRAVEWSFCKEIRDVSGPEARDGARSTHSTRVAAAAQNEIWRQAHVGRFKVDRLVLKVDDPLKPPSQRVNVRHIVDPFSKGNTRGGPMSVVHKHSRAVAFSIFRKYDLFSNRQRGPGGSVSMPTSSSILLATRRVQEQYTSTKTTSQLNSHGLLRERESRSRGPTGSGSTGSAGSAGAATDSMEQAHSVSRSHSTPARTEQRPDKGKGKEMQPDSPGTSISSHTSVGSSSSRTTPNEDESVRFAKNYASSSSSGPSAPVSPTISEPQFRFSTAATPDATAAGWSMDGPSSSKFGTPPPTASTKFSSPPPTAVSKLSSPPLTASSRHADPMLIDDEDDEEAPPRTSHAEAFATLDQNSIEYFRGRSEQRPDYDASHSRSIAERLRRRLLGQNLVKPNSRPSPAMALEGHYTPPWMTMAPRSRVEERDRVIQNLSESFKDVGLLPSFKPRSIGKGRRTKEDPVNIFSHVPADSLHMLLPLWAGETDPSSIVPDEDPSIYQLPVEERQYLLVYYVPFDERKEQDKKKGNKRARSGSRAAATSSAGANPKMVYLPSFSVCARLISYHDLLGTGVRLPIDGLAITGSMREAMDSLPSNAIRESRFETPCAIIGICHGRNKGMEFLPDGLAKVGLATAIPSPEETPRVPVSIEAEAEELNWELTPIGRAAVETAWLGCLAMTSFGPDAPTSK